MVNAVKGSIVAVAIVVLGAVGFFGSSCASAMYADHLLLNQIRANAQAQQAEQAEQIRQFQAQQKAAQTPAPTPAK